MKNFLSQKTTTSSSPFPRLAKKIQNYKQFFLYSPKKKLCKRCGWLELYFHIFYIDLCMQTIYVMYKKFVYCVSLHMKKILFFFVTDRDVYDFQGLSIVMQKY